MVSENVTESPVILTTYPLNTGSFSRRKYALPRLFVTTAMKPASDFTTPRRLIALISRHFLPVEQPEPFCCTTGLKNGSRLPLIAHFLSCGLGCCAAGVFSAGAAATVTSGAGADFAATTVLGCSFEAVFGSGFEGS